jgi:hypothetical protein
MRAIEVICGSRLSKAALALVSIVCLAAVLGLTIGARGSRGAVAAPALTFRIGHFQCYSVDPGSTFKQRTVVLVDQFGKSKAVVSQLKSLCTPVRKNGSVVLNRTAHLACYPIASRPAFRPRQVAITNQFEKTTRVVVVRPFQLCVPSGKTVLPGPEPRPAKGLGHYQCYLVKPLRQLKPRRVGLVDQFGKSAPTVVRMVSLCAPVRKNASPLFDKRDHLACYQLRSAQQFHPRRVEIVNQFGRARLVVVQPQTLCLPSLKRLVVARPDLTVSIPSTRTQVSCPTGGGSCITTRDFTVSNIGSANVTTPFDVLVKADPGQSKAITVPSLAAGASVSLTVQLGPDGNCYDPDCTVVVEADSADVVAESNESNNTATRTDLG